MMFVKRYGFLILAILSGIAYPLGFAPFGWRPVLWLSLGVLFFIGQNAPSSKSAFWRGWLWGVAAFGVGVSWVYNSMHDFGGASPIAAGAITATLIVYMALYPALVLWLWSRLFKASHWFIQVLGFALLWSVTEWLRAWVLTGFPWLMSGYSGVDSFFGEYLPLIGALGIGFLMALCSAALVSGLQEPRRLPLMASLPIVLFIGSVGLSAWQSQIPSEGKTTIALVQGNIPQAVKLQPKYQYLSLDTYSELSQPYLNKADLIIWPETAMPDYAYRLQTFFEGVRNVTENKKARIFTGVFTVSKDDSKGKYHNSMIEIGGQQQRYHKHQLVPFGEYMPLRWVLNVFSMFVQIPMSDMASGDLLTKPMSLNGVHVAPSICYEMAYPDVLRAAIKGSQLMVNTSNDAWFGDSLAPKQHLEMARTRSKAFHKPMARGTNNGLTATIDAMGNIQKAIPQFQAGVLFDELQLNDYVTPYARIGQNAMGVLFSIALFVLAFVSWRMRRA